MRHMGFVTGIFAALGLLWGCDTTEETTTTFDDPPEVRNPAPGTTEIEPQVETEPLPQSQPGAMPAPDMGADQSPGAMEPPGGGASGMEGSEPAGQDSGIEVQPAQ